MDARIRTGADASNPPPGGPAGAGYCPPGTSPGAKGGAAGAGAKSGAGTGATGAGGGESSGYSASFGDVGMSDFPGAGGAAGGQAGSNGHGHHPADAFRDAGLRFGELKEFASYYVAAKLDAIKVTGRNLGIYAALGIVGLIAGGTIISTAAVLLLVGLALAIGKPFEPDQPWVGALVVGVLVLGGLAAGIILFMKKLTNTSRKRVVEKYENRQRDQRINFGEDVRGRRAGTGV
jgi:hypothetical protein